MKRLLQVSLVALMMLAVMGQDASAQEFRKIDSSPLDMAAFRPSREDAPIVRVLYSRPQKKGREIFGELIPFDKVWRTGANEAVEIMFYQDVKVGDKKVKAGRYQLFTIPGEKEWTVIINKKTDEWGAYNYDESADVVRVKVAPTMMENEVEAFSMTFEKAKKGTELLMAWDKTLVRLPIMF